MPKWSWRVILGTTIHMRTYYDRGVCTLVTPVRPELDTIMDHPSAGPVTACVQLLRADADVWVNSPLYYEYPMLRTLANILANLILQGAPAFSRELKGSSKGASII